VKKVIAIAAVIVLLIGVVIYAYLRQRQPAEGGGAFGPGQQSVPVETELVVNGDIAKTIMATGFINARAEVEVYPKQTGELVELLIDKGDRVKAGQALAKIESRLFEIQIKQAQADLAGAKAAYDKSSSLAFINSETDFKQAKGSLDRLQSVLKQAELDLQLQKKQADVQVKKASSDLRIAQARLDAAISGARDQELEQAKVRADNAKRDLDRLNALLKDEMVSQDQVEAAQLQYDIYSAQLSLLEEGLRPEDIQVLKAQVEAAKASLESAENDKMLIDIKQSSLEAAQAQVDNAQAAFDQAAAARDASTWEKDLAQAQASVQRAQASLDMAQKGFDDSTIKAPIGGIITQRLLDKGDSASLSRPFVTIVDMDVVKIAAKVPARDIGGIDVGDQAVVKPDAYPGESFPGTVANISPIIDRSSQTCDIEVEAPNPDYKLKPGMFTRVDLTVLEHNDVPVIPVDALVKEGEEVFVYVVSDGKALKKKVTTGLNDGIKTEVLSGLKAGEEFIMAGKYSLRDEMPVTVRQAQGQGEGISQ
jgi:RND family efflux transporter MFP subunit